MTNLRNLMCAGGYENETGIEMGEVGMSDLRELRDTIERVFKQVCRLSAENKNLARLQGDLGDIFGRLALAVAKQEALSPAPQNTERAPDPEGEYQWVPKGFVVVPEEPNLDMLVFGERAEPIARNIYPSKIYKAMIAARPPVPKKGERV